MRYLGTPEQIYDKLTEVCDKLARTERALEKCKEQRDNFMERDYDGEERVACDADLTAILEGKESK